MSSYDPTDIKSQERTRAEQDQAAKLARDTEESDLKWMMSTKRGRRIVYGIIDRSCVHKAVFNTNAMTMAFVSGRQLEGARHFDLINSVCPETYPLMITEAKTKEDKHD